MPFPVTPRYFINFRNSDTGLTPTFTFFKEAVAPFNNVTPPTVVERSNGMYYFDWTWTSASDVDIIFQLDGGPSIPTEEVRYVKGVISPRDRFVDEPTSKVVSDVWTDTAVYTPGQKGRHVSDIGLPTDTSTQATVFGKTLAYKESIRGDTAGTNDGNDIEQVFDGIVDVKGAGWTATDNLQQVKAAVDAINVETDPTAIANAVWNELITGHQTANSMGRVLNDIFRVLKNKAIINATTKKLEVYDDAGASIIFSFDLKDENGVASATRIFQRLPL